MNLVRIKFKPVTKRIMCNLKKNSHFTLVMEQNMNLVTNLVLAAQARGLIVRKVIDVVIIKIFRLLRKKKSSSG